VYETCSSHVTNLTPCMIITAMFGLKTVPNVGLKRRESRDGRTGIAIVLDPMKKMPGATSFPR
jgi:hypothetical protein